MDGAIYQTDGGKEYDGHRNIERDILPGREIQASFRDLQGPQDPQQNGSGQNETVLGQCGESRPIVELVEPVHRRS